MRHLVINPSQPAESRRFQLAHQLAALALAGEIATVVEASPLRTAAARQLLHVGLANYAAGAVLMPYAPSRARARAVRHDIDRLRDRRSDVQGKSVSDGVVMGGGRIIKKKKKN